MWSPSATPTRTWSTTSRRATPRRSGTATTARCSSRRRTSTPSSSAPPTPPRPRLGDGDEPGQALLLREAADALDFRGAADAGDGAEEQGGDADGQLRPRR